MRIKVPKRTEETEEIEVDFPLYVYDSDCGETWFSELAFRVEDDGKLYEIRKRSSLVDDDISFEIEVSSISFDNGLGWFLDQRDDEGNFDRLLAECRDCFSEFPEVGENKT